MTKRYFGRDGQRTARTAEPEPEEWIPVIKRLARGEISKRAARDELTVSDARINAMVAHIRGEAADPTIARRAMDDKLARPTNIDLYRKRQHSIEPVFGNWTFMAASWRWWNRRHGYAVAQRWAAGGDLRLRAECALLPCPASRDAAGCPLLRLPSTPNLGTRRASGGRWR